VWVKQGGGRRAHLELSAKGVPNMGEMPGRNEETRRVELPQLVSAVADHVLRGDDVSPHIMMGPLVWRDDDRWYFVICGGDRNGFRIDKIVVGDDREIGERCRSSVHLELLQRPPLVLHDFDDELEMAKWCEAIWPSEKTRQIRTSIEEERALWRTRGSA
jgi:hypothetical protein